MQLEIVFEDSEHDESAGGRDPEGEDQVNQGTAYQNWEQQAGFEYYQQPGFYSRAVLFWICPMQSIFRQKVTNIQ